MFGIVTEISVIPSEEDLLMVTMFLVALATGNRVSEIHALLRGSDYVEFCDEGVRLYTNPNFLAKNESPAFRKEPIFISKLFNTNGSVHPLCPVVKLQEYLRLTSSSTSVKLFVNPLTLRDLSLFKIRFFLCKFIRIAEPESFPKTHDLRKYASSFAFFRGMRVEDICNLVGWASFRVFKKHYLKSITEIKSAIVVLGSSFPGSRKDI